MDDKTRIEQLEYVVNELLKKLYGHDTQSFLRTIKPIDGIDIDKLDLTNTTRALLTESQAQLVKEANVLKVNIKPQFQFLQNKIIARAPEISNAVNEKFTEGDQTNCVLIVPVN